MSRRLVPLALAAAAVLALRRRAARRARVGLYLADGLLVSVPPASPAGLELRAAAGDVLRAFTTVYPGEAAGKDV
jgi:hypothetical protein